MSTKKLNKIDIQKNKRRRLKVLRLWIFLSALFLILIIILVVLIHPKPENEVCFKYKCFKVETVSTPETREKGLMFRTQLDENRGMLFVFEKENVYPFWMKNTLLPLDMIWINSSKQISYIYANATSCEEVECPPIYPNSTATYVLEINAGLTEFYSINIGDNVEIK